MVAMDVYHIWFNLKEGVSDIEFVENRYAAGRRASR